MQIIKIKSVEISYTVHGQGDPIILLNGHSGSFYHWHDDFLNTLYQHFTVYCLNYRGIGYSKSDTNEVLSIQNMAMDILNFIEILSLNKANLLGFSMGGYILQECALLRSEKLGDLFFIATATGGKKNIESSPEVQVLRNLTTKTIEERIALRLKLNFPNEVQNQFYDQQKKWIHIYDLPESKLDENMQLQQSLAIETWKKSFSDEKYKKYANIKNKSFIFAGLKDIIIKPENSLVLADLLFDAKLSFYKNAGHGILSQYPIDIAKLINYFHTTNE